MRIAGIQKLTLLDFPGHIAATVFTPGCDMRCPFCHNSELVNDSENLEYYPNEVLDFLKTRVGKLDGVAITGGEPLMQDGIRDFIKDIKDMGMKVKLDTNGTFPDKLKSLMNEGLLDYVAMDIKNCPGSWAKTAGLLGDAAEILFKKTLQSMELLKSGNVEFEFRTTVVRELHSEEDMEKLAQFIGPVEHYFIQKFTDSGAILSDGFSAWDDETMKHYLSVVQKYVPNAKLRGID